MAKFHVTVMAKVEKVYEVEAKDATHAHHLILHGDDFEIPLSETDHDWEIEDVSKVEAVAAPSPSREGE